LNFKTSSKRRHTEKSNHWTAGRYWHTFGNRNWVFSTKDKQLKSLSDTKIVRHTPLKLDKNPHLDEEYFVTRKLKQGIKKLTDVATKILDKAKKICKPENETMTNNCCPN